MRRAIRIGFMAGLVGVLAMRLRRTLDLRRQASTRSVSPEVWTPLEPRPETTATAPAAPTTRPSGPTWVEPVDGACPAGHTVKAKVSSGIFHLPGMLAYERTRPDRCYASEADAESDGFTKAKR